MKLRSLLFIATSVITLIPVVFFGIWPHTHAFENEIARVSEQHVLIAKNIARVLERYDRDVKAAFRLLAKNVVEETRLEEVEILLDNFHILSICAIAPQSGKVVHALNNDNNSCPAQLSDDHFAMFSRRADAGVVEFTQVLEGPDGSPRLYLVSRLDDYLAVGVISTDYIVALGMAVAFGERGHAAIVDHQGSILAHPLADWRQERRDISALAPVEHMLARETGVTTFYSPAMKGDVIAGYTWVPGSNWGVMVPQPVQELRQRADAAQRNALFVIVLGVVAAALVSWFVSGYLTRPVRAVVAAARRMTAGDHQVRAPDMGRLAPSEIKELGSSFNAMAEAIDYDLRTRQRVEKALRDSEARFRAFNDHSPNIMHIKDLDGRFVMINKGSADFMGASEEEIIGKTAFDLFPAEEAKVFDAHDRAVLESGHAIEREERIMHNDGYHTFITAKFPIRNAAGEIVAIGAAGSDLTHHKQAEERLHHVQKLEAIGQLTGGIAHDFNNLLAIIVGNLEELEKRLTADRESHAIVQRAMAAAGRGSDLIQRLLAFSRKQALKPCSIDVLRLLTDMANLFDRTLGENIEVEIRGQAGLWPCLADPLQLENALINLAINARDAMPQGGKLTIEAKSVSFEEAEEESEPEAMIGEFVAITVTDSGTGMAQDVADNAFEPFFTTKEVGAGSGLGLSMVYGFARQSAGYVSIESEAQRGTTVTLYLPRSTAPTVEVPQRRESREPRGRGETILVVEDEAEVRELIARALCELGYRALEAGSGEQALKVGIDRPELDLLLSDIVLPGGLSGPELAEALRKERPNTRVLFMSGYATDALAHDSKIVSNAELIMKPFKMPELARKIRAQLDA